MGHKYKKSAINDYNRRCCTFSERCSIPNSVENALDERHQVRTSKYIIYYTFIQIPDFSCPPTCVVLLLLLLIYSPKKCRNMVIFEDSSIIIEIGQTTAWIDVKVIGGPRMVVVMYYGCHQGSEDFQVRHPILKWYK